MTDGDDRKSGRVLHALPGRVRVHLPQIKRNARLAEQVRRALSELPGIKHVSTNTAAACVTIEYDSERVEEIAGSSPEAMRQAGAPGQDIRRWLVPPVDEVSATWDFTQLLMARLGRLNKTLGDMTGGMDLRVLVPIALFAMGIRSLMLSKKPALPDWHTLLWFAFGTFIALNPQPPGWKA